MKAKKFLRQAIWLDKLIDSKLEQLEKLEALAQKTTVDLTKEKVSGEVAQQVLWRMLW